LKIPDMEITKVICTRQGCDKAVN